MDKSKVIRAILRSCTSSDMLILFIAAIKFISNVVIINAVNKGTIDANAFFTIFPLSIFTANKNRPIQYSTLPIPSKSL